MSWCTKCGTLIAEAHTVVRCQICNRPYHPHCCMNHECTPKDRACSVMWITAARQVVARHAFVLVDPATNEIIPDKSHAYEQPEDRPKGKQPKGVLLDAVTANMLCTVYDAISPKSQQSFGCMPIMRAVDVGWKVMQKAGA